LGRQANPKSPGPHQAFSRCLGASPEGQSEIDYVVEAGLVQQYQIDVGLRTPTSAAFLLEPQIKEETLTYHHGRRTIALLERKGPSAFLRKEEGKREPLGIDLLAPETALGALKTPALLRRPRLTADNARLAVLPRHALGPCLSAKAALPRGHNSHARIRLNQSCGGIRYTGAYPSGYGRPRPHDRRCLSGCEARRPRTWALGVVRLVDAGLS